MNVPVTAAGERLDRFLAAHLGSRAAAERAIDAGALVDGIARPKSFRLEGGEDVVLRDEVAVPDLPAPPEPAIVWEDKHVLVIDKPPGLVVHPGAGHPNGNGRRCADVRDGVDRVEMAEIVQRSGGLATAAIPAPVAAAHRPPE